MQAIRLSARARAEMLAHAREDAPRECCGLLVGTDTTIDECIRTANLDQDPNRYRIDPEVHIAANRRLRGSGRAVIGVYHSHPRSAAIPSPTDYLEAYYSDFIWVIVSLAVPEAEAVAAYRLAPSGFVLSPIERLEARGEVMSIIESIRGEYLRYKKLAEAAIAQVPDDKLAAIASDQSNSIIVICWHVSGNLKSRFTDFLTADGEKPWRKRDEEFDAREVGRADLLTRWEDGWSALFGALAGLSDDALSREVTIRDQKLSVIEALHRSLAHTSYHVGQIVYLAREAAGSAWTSLSIPKGQSAAFNANPSGQKPAEQIAALERGRQ
jgi:proteasome lid subunit RPN8/RPN11